MKWPLIAYSVTLSIAKQPIWTRIGAAWAHKTGAGPSIELDALPPEGRIVLVAPRAEPKAAADDACSMVGSGIAKWHADE